jgi:glucosamine--fructose-6-phosphate aminotransferase (isomerizing)
MGTIVVGVTASGRSLVTIDALRRAKSKGAEIVVLTDNPQGKAVEYADHVWTTMAGVSTYDTSPSSPTTTAMAYLLRLVGGIESKCQDKVERDIAKLKSNGRQMLAWAEQEGEEIGKSARADTTIYLISEGPNHTAARIGMMKFNEYSMVRGQVAGREDFRHHFNLAVKPTDGAVLICDSPTKPEDEVFMNVVMDTLGLSAHNICVDTALGLETPLAQVIPNTIALQMAAYHSALRLNPDKTQFKEPHASAFRIY